MIDGVSLVLNSSGESIDKLLSYELDSAFTTLTDGFSARLYADDLEKLRNLTRPLQPVTWYVNGKEQCIGRIDSQSIDNDGVISISGRDYLAAIGDSFIDNTTIKKGTPIKDAILKVLKPFGITTVEDYTKVRNTQSGASPYSGAPPVDINSLKCEEIKSNPNEGAFEFIKRIISRHGILLMPGSSRSAVCLTAPEYRSEPLFTFTRFRNGSHNNVISGSVERDYSEAPTVIVATGRTGGSGETAKSINVEAPGFGPSSPSPLGKVQEVSDITSGSVIAKRLKTADSGDPNLLYRPLYIKDTESKTQKELDKFVKRELANRLKGTLAVSYTLAGHSDPKTGYLYAVDCMAKTEDEIAGVFEALWIEKRTFSYSEGSGPTTNIQLWRPASFEL